MLEINICFKTLTYAFGILAIPISQKANSRKINQFTMREPGPSYLQPTPKCPLCSEHFHLGDLRSSSVKMWPNAPSPAFCPLVFLLLHFLPQLSLYRLVIQIRNMDTILKFSKSSHQFLFFF